MAAIRARSSSGDIPLAPLTWPTTSRTRRRAGRDSGAAGAILTSGFYDLGKEVSVWKTYYGDDVSTYAERSSLPGLLKTVTPLLVTDAELDPEMFQTQANLLAAERSKIGKPVQRVHLKGIRTSRRRSLSARRITRCRTPLREFVAASPPGGT